MGDVKVTAITDVSELGEGPHWVPEEQTLYYVDIMKGKIHKYHAPTKKHTSAQIEGGRVPLIVPVENKKDTFVIGIERELVVIHWEGDQVKILKRLGEVEKEYPPNRFNDGKCDSSGRLWAGTMSPECDIGKVPEKIGSVYSLDFGGQITSRHSPVGISNGLAWSADNSKFYYIDSHDNTVDVFDFDISTSCMKNRRTIYDFKSKNETGIPDGMTIDADGNLWVGCYFGKKVICINPETGEKLREIPFPVSNLTSCTFGGPSNNILYVTSSRVGLSKEELEKEPLAGAIFQVEGLQVKGTPCIACKVDY